MQTVLMNATCITKVPSSVIRYLIRAGRPTMMSLKIYKGDHYCCSSLSLIEIVALTLKSSTRMSEQIIMAEETYPIEGIPVVPGQDIPVRREITDWYEDENSKYQVSLFLQSLTILMKKPVEERLSYFQIAGMSSRDVGYILG